jgi:hypothetical protein
MRAHLQGFAILILLASCASLVCASGPGEVEDTLGYLAVSFASTPSVNVYDLDENNFTVSLALQNNGALLYTSENGVRFLAYFFKPCRFAPPSFLIQLPHFLCLL